MPSSGFQTSARSEEHTSELQSHDNLVCRLLLEKKSRHHGPDQPRWDQRRCLSGPCGRATPPHPREVGDVPSAAHPTSGSSDGIFSFFFNSPAPPKISPLSLPDALPI